MHAIAGSLSEVLLLLVQIKCGAVTIPQGAGYALPVGGFIGWGSFLGVAGKGARPPL